MKTSEYLTQQLERYGQRFAEELKLMTPLRNQLALNTNPFDRHTLPGHITASGILIVNKKLLMIFHPFLKKWLQPGGHVEAEETPLEAAHRELFEETGVNGSLHEWHVKNPMPIDINVHLIPANPAKGEPEHMHYDFRYLFTRNDPIRGTGEHDHEVAWKNPDELHEPNLKALIGKLGSENILVR
jgi:8-oxo-dGTP pyrophosphatase MutT (NUDIX family)